MDFTADAAKKHNYRNFRSEKKKQKKSRKKQNLKMEVENLLKGDNKNNENDGVLEAAATTTLTTPKLEAIASLGRGSFATCILARDLRHSKNALVVAKKVQKKYREQAIEEGRILKLLTKLAKSDPTAVGAGNVVRSTATLVSERHAYILLEWMEGGTLGALLDECRRTLFNGESEGENSLERPVLADLEILAFGQQNTRTSNEPIEIFAGLCFIHRAGVVHRDVKPDNLLLTGDRLTLKLADFGHARRLALGEKLPAERRALADGAAAGSRPYAAPETLTAYSYDHRSDCWSGGCVFYELVALRRAFPGADDAALDRRITQGRYEPLPPFSTPSPFEAVISLLLQKDQADRPPSAEVVERLAQLAAELLPGGERDAAAALRRQFLAETQLEMEIETEKECTKNLRETTKKNFFGASAAIFPRRWLRLFRRGDERGDDAGTGRNTPNKKKLKL